MELFEEEVFYAMGNAIGKAVKIDDTTLIVCRGRYVRVCVEVNLNEPLVPFIIVLGTQQRVEYEGLHIICFGCGKYGHREDGCPGHGRGSPAIPVEKQATTIDGEKATLGPWMHLNIAVEGQIDKVAGSGLAVGILVVIIRMHLWKMP